MREIRFIDSLKFMSVSLESLVNNLEKDEFHNVKKRVFSHMIIWNVWKN